MRRGRARTGPDLRLPRGPLAPPGTSLPALAAGDGLAAPIPGADDPAGGSTAGDEAHGSQAGQQALSAYRIRGGTLKPGSCWA